MHKAGGVGLKFVLFGLVLFSIVGIGAAAPDSPTQAPLVDPRVLQDTSTGADGDFIVLLKSQANARALALRAPDRRSQGEAVFQGLKQIADATQPGISAELGRLGASYRAYWIVNAIAVKGNRTVVDAMLSRPDVAAIESNRSFRVPLEQAKEGLPLAPNTVQWNIDQIHAPALWAKGYTGQGRVYANADTGVQWNHPALERHYRGWDGTTANHNYSWWDAIHSDLGGNPKFPCTLSSTVPCDDFGHGTHVMGIGIGDDGQGNLIGVAPGATWIACRNMQGGVGQPSTYIECFQFFMAPTDLNGKNPDPSKRPDVISNSYDCPPEEGCTPNSLLQAVANLRAAGVFISASAGNSGASGCSSIDAPPAIYDPSVTVGATDSSDAIASFSSMGPVTVDGSNRRKPDLAAPGVGVMSSYPFNTYATESGTSMAAPHVAGTVALLWSAFPKLVGNVDLTESVLETSALHKASGQGCGGDSVSAIPNNVYGYGRIDALNAYNYQGGFIHSLFFPFISKGP